MSLRRHPSELEQREHLALRFGLILRRDAGPLADRIVRSAGLRRALAVPYYSLLHNGNAVPREAVGQRGRLQGTLALQVGAVGLSAAGVSAHAEHLARMLLEEHAAHGAVYGVRALVWDPVEGAGVVEVDASTATGGLTRLPVSGGDLTPVLEVLLAAVLPPGTAGVVVRDPVDISDDPGSWWRWAFPVRSHEAADEFLDLHRQMSFAVLRALGGVPSHELRPLKTVPDWYVDLP